jgi:hypothetical protein
MGTGSLPVCLITTTLDNHYAQGIGRFVFSSVTCLVYHIFYTSSHKRQVFQENVIEHKMCVLIFSTTFV